MARAIHKLSARRAETLKEPGRHSDGGGLYLSIVAADAGAKGARRRWVFMYSRNGKRVELGLGSGRDMSLLEARSAAEKMRALLARDVDPKTQRIKDRVEGVTFGECADAYIAAKVAKKWKSDKHAYQWKMTLGDYGSAIRNKPVANIETADVVAVLLPLWDRVRETAKRLQSRIETILDEAKANGHRSGENPARWRGHLEHLLEPLDRSKRGHHAALAYLDMPSFMTALRTREAVAARALEFTILTAGRTAEILGARWEEVDLEQAVWIVPATRMKMGREHRVPLSVAALDVLKALTPTESGLIFGSAKPDKPLSSMAMLMLLRRIARPEGLTTHGFRSTFRDWGAEQTSFPSEVLEMALAHTVKNKVEAAYRRGDLLEKRRALMEAWGSYCVERPTGGLPSRRVDAE